MKRHWDKGVLGFRGKIEGHWDQRGVRIEG